MSTNKAGEMQKKCLLFGSRSRFAMLAARATACLADGCSPSAKRVARVASSPVVPAHPRADLFVGDWAIDGEVGVVISHNSADQILIKFPKNAFWESVINNVRFVGDELHYDQYFYYVGSEDLTMSGNLSGDHPFSGVCNHTVLALVDEEPDKLLSWIVSEDLAGIEKVAYQRPR